MCLQSTSHLVFGSKLLNCICINKNTSEAHMRNNGALILLKIYFYLTLTLSSICLFRQPTGFG